MRLKNFLFTVILVSGFFAIAEVLAYLEAEQLKPSALVLTHAHADHIGGIVFQYITIHRIGGDEAGQ